MKLWVFLTAFLWGLFRIYRQPQATELAVMFGGLAAYVVEISLRTLTAPEPIRRYPLDSPIHFPEKPLLVIAEAHEANRTAFFRMPFQAGKNGSLVITLAQVTVFWNNIRYDLPPSLLKAQGDPKMLTRDAHNAIRDRLIFHGLARWKGQPNSRDGYDITPLGCAVLEKIVMDPRVRAALTLPHPAPAIPEN